MTPGRLEACEGCRKSCGSTSTQDIFSERVGVFYPRSPAVLETRDCNKIRRRDNPSGIDTLPSHGLSSNYQSILNSRAWKRRYYPSRSSMDIVEFPDGRRRSRSHSPSPEPLRNDKCGLRGALRRVSSASDGHYASQSNHQIGGRFQSYRTRSPVGSRNHVKNQKSV